MLQIRISVDTDNGAILFEEEISGVVAADARVGRMFREDRETVLVTLVEADEARHQFRANPGEAGLWATWWCQRAV